MVSKQHISISKVKRVSILLSILFRCWTLHSQDTLHKSYLEISNYAEERYGPSVDLINGEKYHYPYRSATGDPFFYNSESSNASIQIGGKVFENQRIRFDIYNQVIVLDFTDMNGASRSIILRTEWLDQLVIEGTLFKKYPDENGAKRFGQVVFEGKSSCIYFWTKRYVPDLKVGDNRYKFSEPIRQSYIVVNGKSFPYTGKASFLKCFSEKDQERIKSYLKKNRIRIRKSSGLEIRSLMDYINLLAGDED